MSLSKVKRSLVNTIKLSPLAESQSFNGYLAPAARTSQQLQNDYMKHFAARGGFQEPLKYPADLVDEISQFFDVLYV
jgi:hypothetical protein